MARAGWKRRTAWVVGGLTAVAVVWVVADGVHAAYIAWSYQAWVSEQRLTDDGVLVGCEAYTLPPADGASSRGAVLLVHGFNASPRHWDLIAPELADEGFHVRVMRLPGFAEPQSLWQERDADQWVAAVAAELAALRHEHERVGVVGHSLGGAVTIRTVIDHPAAADWAVLVAPAIAVSGARSPLLPTRAWHEIAEGLLVFSRVLVAPFPMDCRVPGRTDWPGRLPFASREVIDALFELLDRNLADAEQLTTPVTMLVAAEDRIVDTPAAAAYYQRLGAEQKRLVVLDASGHEAPLDRQWPRIVEAVKARDEG
ncbi:alpha/beta fold hydrolase [Botrimarina sp.]|uniref:alpha/beta hydrolase n=1 Tax=Botrimarina sp. TaxID=2795802 RepID=UPI0032ECFF2F